LRYLKARKDQGGRVAQWEGVSKQTARQYVGNLRKLLKAAGKNEEEVLASLTEENMSQVVDELYNLSKTIKIEENDTKLAEAPVEQPKTEVVEETEKEEVKEKETDEKKVEEKKDEALVSEPAKEKEEAVVEEKELLETSGREIVKQNVQRSREMSRRFVHEREEKKEEQVEAKPADSSPRKSFLAGLFSQPIFIYVVIGVLALIVIALLFKRKETPSQPSVTVVQPQQPAPTSQSANPVRSMMEEINSMFGAELWRP
jgi:hypothetical protein